ncbi:hypothetical protein GCM10007968_03970 [Sporolactobacillus putidus]|uniref:LXG domain-containing protein n=1 Tax=Sporolactobacillus putidus TaxID=492735 RepID=A0A917RXS7_9BACL|nr:hypothetical protein GCM10007968_03970 [Sporolactobacillus putidus]
MNVVDAWLRLINKQIAFLNGLSGEIDDKSLGGDTFVQMPFLEQDLANGHYRSKAMVAQQKEDIGQILRSISDLVPMNVFSTHNVDQALDEADHERNRMIHDVQGLDRELTTEYRQVMEDVPAIAALYGELIQATRQGADIQPMHFNARAYHDSKIYQLQGELEKAAQSYLDEKKQQEKAREVKKEEEDRVDSVLQTAYSLVQLGQKINDGIATGLLDAGKDTILGLWATVTTSPVEVIGNVVNAALHPVRTYDIIKTAIVQSYERDMVHGNAYTRSRWITYALAMVATSVVGTKGVDKVGKAADLAELSSKAGTIKTASKMATHDLWPQNGLQTALAGAGGTPYNVINSTGLRDKLLGVARQNQGTGSFDPLNQARSLIQQMSVKKVSGSKRVSKANPEKVVNALTNYKSRRWTFGSAEFVLDKSGMKHILERHHAEYWDGSIKSMQTFLDENMSIDDITNIVSKVLKQNREKLIEKGTTGMYQVEGIYRRVDYVVGLNKGRVGQFYKK